MDQDVPSLKNRPYPAGHLAQSSLVLCPRGSQAYTSRQAATGDRRPLLCPKTGQSCHFIDSLDHY